MTNVVHEAAKNGDRSENGDYIYGKRRLREIDSRVRFLNKRLDELEVVDRPPADQSRVRFGRLGDTGRRGRCRDPLPHCRAGRVRPAAEQVEHGLTHGTSHTG